MTLGVQILNDRDIVVSRPDTGFSVTYRKDGDAPMLVAIDGIDEVDRFPDPETIGRIEWGQS